MTLLVALEALQLALTPLVVQRSEAALRKVTLLRCSAHGQAPQRDSLERPPRMEKPLVLLLVRVELAAQTGFPEQEPRKAKLPQLQADRTETPAQVLVPPLPVQVGQTDFGKETRLQRRAERQQTEMPLPQVPVETDAQCLAPVEQVEMEILEEALQSSVAVCFEVLESTAGWLVECQPSQRLDGNSQGIQR